MTHDAHQKVKASHLKRSAYLYVRQSTLRTQRLRRIDNFPVDTPRFGGRAR